MRSPFVIAALLAICASDAAAQAGGPTAAEVAADLQRRYDTVRDFTANFTHQHTGGPLRRKLVEQGRVQVKRPGRMRWEYAPPDEKVFVSNGKQVYFYDRENNQVTISEMPQGDQAASAAQFLSGRGNIARDYQVSFAGDATAGAWALKLVPRAPQNEFDWLEVVVDRSSLRIRTLTAVEPDGGRSTFTFTDVKENVGIADKTFEFQIPRGAEVIHAGRPKD